MEVLKPHTGGPTRWPTQACHCCSSWTRRKHGADPEFLRDGLRLLVQELMDTEVTQLVGAGPYERTDTRLTQRNGYREREWDTRVGTVELQIPKLRHGWRDR